jgi:IS30 family transposase
MSNDETARKHYDGWDVEGDTVIGRPGGKCLLTIVFVTSELFLARLLDQKTQACVVAALDELERIFKRHRLRLTWQGEDYPWWFFNTFLTDNGPELGDFKSMERTVFKGRYEGMARMQVYYCDPYCSWQKPRIEVAHTLLRRVLPKGTSFDHLTQADIDRICSHINSYSRENLNGAYPFEAAPSGFCGDGILNALGLKIINPDAINLTPGLLTR